VQTLADIEVKGYWFVKRELAVFKPEA